MPLSTEKKFFLFLSLEYLYNLKSCLFTGEEGGTIYMPLSTENSFFLFLSLRIVISFLIFLFTWGGGGELFTYPYPLKVPFFFFFL